MRVKERTLVIMLMALFVVVSVIMSIWLINIDQKNFVKINSYKRGYMTNLLKKNDKDFHIRQRGQYWIMYNYIAPKRTYAGNESVTMTLHGEYTNLNTLSQIVGRWRAPISFTLFTNGLDFEKSIKAIEYLTKCEVYGEEIQNFVTFNFFMHEDHIPKSIPHSPKQLSPEKGDCFDWDPFEQRNKTYRITQNLSYPINLARNIARQTALTYYILAIDTDYVPSVNFPKEFLQIATKIKLKNPLKTVFVLPVIRGFLSPGLPETKEEIMDFNKTYFLPDLKERIPNIFMWYDNNPYEDLFDIVQIEGEWQPWYVSANEYEPFADENLTEETHAHRSLKIDLLKMLDYDFAILNNAFLVHSALSDASSNNDISIMDNKTYTPANSQYFKKLLILKNFLMNFM